MSREREPIQLVRIREEVGKPTQEEVDLVLNEFVGRFVRRDNPLSPEEKDKTLEQLRLAKLELERKGFSSTRVALSSGYIFLLKSHFLKEAETMLNDNAVQLFRFYYDYSLGFGALVGQIDESANKGHSSVDENISTYIFQRNVAFGLQRPTSEDADEYLHTSSRVLRNAESLKSDPTGFLLADEISRTIGQDKDFERSNVSVDYVIAGAEHARDLYKETYEIAGALYPAQSM